MLVKFFNLVLRNFILIITIMYSFTYSSFILLFMASLKGRIQDYFLGGGALVSCSTSTPINHIVFFFGRIPVVLENCRSSQGGRGVAHSLHPPPRSAPALNISLCEVSSLYKDHYPYPYHHHHHRHLYHYHYYYVIIIF